MNQTIWIVFKCQYYNITRKYSKMFNENIRCLCLFFSRSSSSSFFQKSSFDIEFGVLLCVAFNIRWFVPTDKVLRNWHQCDLRVQRALCCRVDKLDPIAHMKIDYRFIQTLEQNTAPNTCKTHNTIGCLKYAKCERRKTTLKFTDADADTITTSFPLELDSRTCLSFMDCSFARFDGNIRRFRNNFRNE